MPYDNVPDHLTDKMDSCVTDVKAQGHDEDSAIAICYTQIVESEEMDREHHIIEAQIVAAKTGPEFAGREWDVTIIGADSRENVVEWQGKEWIESANDRLYSCEALAGSVHDWDGVRVYDNHLTDEEYEERGGMRSVKDEWIGNIVKPGWDAAKRKLGSTLKIVDEALARKLKAAWDLGVLETIGLSIDTIPQSRSIMREGQKMDAIEGFKQILSVDLVSEPAAGGGFERLIAARQHMEATMFTDVQKKEINGMIADALAAVGMGTQEQVEESPEEVIAEVEAAVEEVAEVAPPDAPPAEVAQAAADAAQEVADEIAGEEAPAEEESVGNELAKLKTDLMVRDKLEAAKLSAKAKNVIKEAFAGKVAKPEEVDKMIKSVREAVAQADPTGRVTGAGKGSGAKVGMSGEDWREVEFLRLMAGNTKFRALENIEDETTQERLTESYKNWIKGGRQRGNTRRLSEWLYNGFGDPYSDPRFYEAATTSSLSSIVKNAVNIILASDFQARHQWWQPIVREEEVDTIDAPTLIRWFGIGNLDVVDEGQAYTEKALVDEEETAAFVKRGNYVGITLETLLRDKVNKVRAIPELLADSWYNTLSNLVATVFTVNSAAGPILVGSAGALFNSTAATGHANLLTAPLSWTAYDAARTAMRKQTSADVGLGPKLLINPKYILVPVDLEATAKRIMGTEYIPGGADNDVNPWQNESEVIVVPEWADANNWALVADPVQYPSIWVIYHRGNRVPELFTSDNEAQGSMFTNDTLRYKVRQLSFRYSSTYDCAPVSDFRPLHKNNVA
jgi:hypothetical protein